jgi:acetyl esterase/lipase
VHLSCLARLTAALAAFAVILPAHAVEIPAAVISDQAPDPANPARTRVLYIPSGGVDIHGLDYAPSGPGPHPVVLILHGWPGNEKNLDLARSAQRAGWHAITFNYRGAWGSPGSWSFANSFADTQAVIAWLRTSEAVKRLGHDPARIAVVGHSLGGWLAARAASADGKLLGAGLISAVDMGAEGRKGATNRDALLTTARNNRQGLAGTSPDAATDELVANADAWGFAPMAAGLKGTPLLVLSSDDGFRPHTDALAADVKAAGGTVEAVHVATDHVWSDSRIQLQARILNWLAALPPAAKRR